MSSEKRNTSVKDDGNASWCWRAPLWKALPAVAFRRCLTPALLSAVLIIGAQTAGAQTESVLYSFMGAADGANPFAGLIQDGKGNLYGTTEFGGIPGCMGVLGCGTVFEITRAGGFKVLYSFSGAADGGNPVGGLVRDGKGNLYGTTPFNYHDYGTVFEIAREGTQKVLHNFTGNVQDGLSPVAGLVRDAQGNLYGTTFYGGATGVGTVFKVTASGAETLLYSFAFQPDGAFPTAGLVRDRRGNLYGTTYQGGTSGYGTVFKVDPSGAETVLHSFTGGEDGVFPYSGLVRGLDGSLYGTTLYTGDFSGYGTVFKITRNGTKNVLYRFGGADGAGPLGVLAQDSQGNLYGTTAKGGAHDYGTVFELTPTGMETVLYSFTGGADGAYPRGVIRDAQGNLYGTTQEGGAFNYGTVFKLVP